MQKLNNATEVAKQYQTAGNLNTRISIHEKYSTNSLGFGNWIISNYAVGENARILELGCGTGSMWKGHFNILSTCTELILTDFSEGMLETAKENLGVHPKLSFAQVDIQEIPYAEESFDIVIANMMLYHVPDLKKGLMEVRRVLKPGGKFYCATYGENGIIDYIEKALAGFQVTGGVSKEFTLQNGKGTLEEFFEKVERLDYEDSLAVTNTEDLVDYVYSLSNITNLDTVGKDTLKQILDSRKEKGVLLVPKEYGMFVCEK